MTITKKKYDDKIKELINEERDVIRIRGAREHNLKNVDLQVPRNQFVVSHRAERFREILPGIRYDLCGRAEEIHGVSVLLCKTVSRTDGESRM